MIRSKINENNYDNNNRKIDRDEEVRKTRKKTNFLQTVFIRYYATRIDVEPKNPLYINIYY